MSDYMRRLREKVGNEYVLVPSVSAVIRNEAGAVLLVRHVEGQWQLPAGAVDPDEAPEDALRRECQEEASIEVRPIRIAGAFGGGPDYRVVYANGDVVGIVTIAYEAVIVAGTPGPGDDETLAVGWFAPEEIDNLDMRSSSRATLRAVLRDS